MRDSTFGLKYVDAIRVNGRFTYSNSDYISFFKYISLCITGQMNFNINNFWKNIDQVDRMKVNLNENIVSNSTIIKTIIANCLFQLKGGIPDEGNHILEYL